jgi:hypothetical protein
MLSLADVLAEGDYPRSGASSNQKSFWLGMDSQETYRARNTRTSTYSETDIVYSLNGHGFRSVEFGSHSGLSVLIAGCSWTFGMGMPADAIYGQLFVNRLAKTLDTPVTLYNLGVSGASNDQICRLLHQTIPRLRPTLVLVLFTHPARREYITADNRRINYTPTARVKERLAGEVLLHLNALSSKFDDQLNLFRNYKSIAALLRDTAWLYSFVTPILAEDCAFQLDRSRLAMPQSRVDRARDESHPGPETHKRICDSFWSQICDSGVLAGMTTSVHRDADCSGGFAETACTADGERVILKRD